MLGVRLEGRREKEMRKLVVAGLAVAVAAALLPSGAEAKTRRVSSNITVDVFGVIDRHGGVTYAFAGGISAHFTFACELRRTVTLFRVEPNGTATPVGSAQSELSLALLGASFTGTLERPLNEIAGSYYAEVAPRTRNFKRQHRKVECLGARSPTIAVVVPPALLTSQ
jgi:hypothetical protein